MSYKIREMRLAAGMTQTELAQKSGISRQTINGLENGTVTVTTTETLIKIASALGKRVSDIFLD